MSQETNLGLVASTDLPTEDKPAFGARIKSSFLALFSSHSGTARPTGAVDGTVWLSTTTRKLTMYDETNDLQIIVLNAAVPSSASDTGTAGQWAADATHLYQCTATDTWVRVAMATW